MKKGLLAIFFMLTITTLSACNKTEEISTTNEVKIDVTGTTVSNTNVSGANVAESASDNDVESEIEEPKPEISVVVSDVVETVEEDHYAVDYRDIMDDNDWLENNFIKIENADSNEVTTTIYKLEYGVNADGTPEKTEITDPNDIITGKYEIFVTTGEGIDSVEQSILIDINGFVPGMLYYADFEVEDYHNVGFHNVVDYFTEYPNGGNIDFGVTVLYEYNPYFEVHGEEALAYRTARGIGLGASIDDVINAYGDIEIEDYITARDYPFISGNQEATYLMTYWCPINSGAFPRIDFIFDQDGKLMCIEMGAVYKIFVNQQVLDYAIPYQAE